jgi:hypothetical protein
MKDDFITQEETLGFYITQIHYVFSEMRQSSLICNLHGFGKRGLLVWDIFSEKNLNGFR